MRICEEHGALNCSSCYIINELESELNSLKSTNAKLVEFIESVSATDVTSEVGILFLNEWRNKTKERARQILSEIKGGK